MSILAIILISSFKGRAMAKKTQLYDLRKKDHPWYAHFRTLQVFECWVCGGLTNLMYAGAAPVMGSYESTVCPSADACWHHELEKKLRWMDKPHPCEYKELLRREIVTMRRSSAKKVKNDLVGKPDLKLKQPVSHTFPNDLSCTCKHSLEYSEW